MMKPKDVVSYYNYTRKAGHTHTMMMGAKNNTNSLIVVASQQQANQLSKQYNIPRKRFVSIQSEVALLGRNNPIVFDNLAVKALIWEFEKQHDLLQQENLRLRLKIKKAKEELADE